MWSDTSPDVILGNLSPGFTKATEAMKIADRKFLNKFSWYNFLYVDMRLLRSRVIIYLYSYKYATPMELLKLKTSKNKH